MQPIIRRTITITITETWTITWEDGHETTWHETHKVAWPTDNESDKPVPSIIDDEASDNDTFDPDVADQAAESE